MNIIQKAIKNYYKRKGYEIVLRKYKLMEGDFPQSVVLPRATYSPWISDQDFQEVYQQVKTHTLVGIYRCYELWQLSKDLRSLDGDFIEVGAWRGGTGAIIAMAAQKYSKGSKTYICDTFEGVVKAGEKDNRYVNGEHADTSEEVVSNLLKGLNIENAEILTGMFPDDTGSFVKDRKFKFCHIDVDVYQGAKEITEWIWDKLVIGGTVVYDDYGFSGTQGVTKFVESQREMEDRIVIHNLNGHGVIVKIK